MFVNIWSMMNKQTLQGFTAIPVKYSEESSASHCIFWKQHSIREKCDEKPADRTLFIINVPPYCTEDNFKKVLGIFGHVVTVFFHKSPNAGLPPGEASQFFHKHDEIKGFKVAYVVFETAVGLQEALSWDATEPLILSRKDAPLTCGIKKWCSEYNMRIPDVDAMQKEIDDFMEKFDHKVAENARLEKQAMEEDDDGWITVTRKGKKPGFARKESIEKKIMSKEKQKRSKKELLNFYTFQIRESKMKHLAKLRQKFEEDKKRINVLKQSRRFKPF
ncbi:ribosomal RNA-processing protein 7 homolog A [Schistocerca piceifrons]|uniref:ribosomal RNA-processing protein 7 homolog A n=1 Tax=Schistocerca piceifrons TaxID=274613 RepID=UPI001F5EB754|nr:ribosomal RNA-processing protein 7 homolog A [Schistocerca piceifrons]